MCCDGWTLAEVVACQELGTILTHYQLFHVRHLLVCMYECVYVVGGWSGGGATCAFLVDHTALQGNTSGALIHTTGGREREREAENTQA